MAPKKKTPKQEPFKVSYSKLSTFRRCLQQYKWKYIDGLYPPSSIGQDRGSAGHVALASWHKEYDGPAALQAAWEAWEHMGHSGGEDWSLLEEALGRYFRWSREVVQDDFTLEMAEQSFQLQYKPKGSPEYQLGGFIDGVVRMPDGKVWFLEHKFYKRMENNHSPLDAQVSTYMLAALRLKIPVQGVIYNKIRIGDSKIAEKEPVVRTRVVRSSYGLAQVEKEIELQARDMIIFHQKGGESAYRNPTKDCSWDCAFHQACVSWADDGEYPARLLQQIIHIRSLENE